MRPADSGTIRVLLVDDESDLADMTGTFLERIDDRMNTVSETSAKDALDRIEEEPIDCVVSDYQMPDMDGLEFLEAVRKAYSDLPFVLFTAHGSEDIASKAIRAGVDHYMQKTTGSDQYEVLANRIRNAVSQRQAKTSYHEIFEKATVGLVVRDTTTGEVLDANQRYCELLGYSREEALELTLGDISPGQGSFTKEHALKRVHQAAEGEVQSFEWRGETKSGESIWLDVNLRLAEIGGKDCVLASVQDITERKGRERRLNALLDATQDLEDATTEQQVLEVGLSAAESVLNLDIAAFHVPTEDGESLEPKATTDGVEELFGTAPSIEDGDAIAWDVFESGEAIVTGDVHQYDQLYNPNTPVRSEIVLPVGKYAVFMAASTEKNAFSPADESLAKVLASNVEAAISRARREMLLREREQALMSQNERLDEFAGVVSHDLRNPLNVAEGHLELAQAKYDDEHLDSVADAHDRMAEIVDDVLALARRGRTIDDPKTVSVSDAVETAANTVTGIGEVIIEDDLGTVDGDPERLAALFENLFRNSVEHGSACSRLSGDNAVEHAEEDVLVRVGTTADGLYVEDDGEGIPPDERDNVFDAGFSTSDDGSGFGLAIVASIVEAHGWEIHATEGTEGGARFEVSGLSD